jgi:hypothetical protein
VKAKIGEQSSEEVLALMTNAVAVKGRFECSRGGVDGCGCADRRSMMSLFARKARPRKTQLPRAFGGKEQS